jgi:hypothetical protein
MSNGSSKVDASAAPAVNIDKAPLPVARKKQPYPFYLGGTSFLLSLYFKHLRSFD